MTKNSSPLLVLNMLSTFPGEGGTRTAGLPQLNCPDVFKPHGKTSPQDRCHDPLKFCFSPNVQHFGLLLRLLPSKASSPKSRRTRFWCTTKLRIAICNFQGERALFRRR